MEGYIADAESLKKTFIRSLATYLKISMSDLAPRRNIPDEKPLASIPNLSVSRKIKNVVEEKESVVKSNGREVLSSVSGNIDKNNGSNSSNHNNGNKNSSNDSHSNNNSNRNNPPQGNSSGSGTLSGTNSAAIDRKIAKYCRETFRDLFVQVCAVRASDFRFFNRFCR